MEQKNKKSEYSKSIELRSEKVRHIINDKPPFFIRWGITIVAVLFAVLIALLLTLPYPYDGGETIFEHLF